VLRLYEVSDNFNLTFKNSETETSIDINVNYGVPTSDLVKLISAKTGESEADLYLTLFNDSQIYVGNDDRPLWQHNINFYSSGFTFCHKCIEVKLQNSEVIKVATKGKATVSQLELK
jgi:hypothetical protein